MRKGFETASIAALWLGLAAAPAGAQSAWPVTGELTDADSQVDERRYDDYPVHLEGGQRYRISVASDAFDPLARLYREGRDEPVAENDDGGGGLNSLIVYAPPESGEFRLRVTSFSAQGRGAYTANVVQRAPLPDAVAAPWSGSGRIDDGDGEGGSSYDEIPVRLEAGQRYRLAVDAQAFDPVASLYAPSGGEPVAANDDAEQLNSRIFYRPQESGIYVLRVASLYSSGRGPYTVEVGLAPPLPAPITHFSAMEATIWRVYAGAIASADPTDSEGRRFDDYLVTFAAGQRRTISLESGDFNSYLRVYRASDREGAPIASDDDSAGGSSSQIVFTAEQEGDYVIRVSGLGRNGGGRYRLRVSER